MKHEDIKKKEINYDEKISQFNKNLAQEADELGVTVAGLERLMTVEQNLSDLEHKLKVIIKKLSNENSIAEFLKNKSFSEHLIKFIGKEFDFIKLGMMIEYNGESGTIVGVNESGLITVEMANKLKYKNPLECHPTNKIKYFDKNGDQIKEFD